jgi:hypothetical protein
MSKYVEIKMQSPTDGSGFVAQWYAGGERSGQAFLLCTIGELLFFAYFTEAPLIVPDDATRAMLHERGVGALSAAGEQRVNRRRLHESRRLLARSPPCHYRNGQSRPFWQHVKLPPARNDRV